MIKAVSHIPKTISWFATKSINAKVLFIISTHAIFFLNLQQPSLKKNNHSHNVIVYFWVFHSWFDFAQNVITLLLQYSKSNDILSFCCFIISWYSKFLKTIINSWKMTHALKPYTPYKAVDIYLKKGKNQLDMWAHRNFHESKFIKHSELLPKKYLLL